jgi:hypothetical protein
MQPPILCSSLAENFVTPLEWLSLNLLFFFLLFLLNFGNFENFFLLYFFDLFDPISSIVADALAEQFRSRFLHRVLLIILRLSFFDTLICRG